MNKIKYKELGCIVCCHHLFYSGIFQDECVFCGKTYATNLGVITGIGIILCLCYVAFFI